LSFLKFLPTKRGLWEQKMILILIWDQDNFFFKYDLDLIWNHFSRRWSWSDLKSLLKWSFQCLLVHNCGECRIDSRLNYWKTFQSCLAIWSFACGRRLWVTTSKIVDPLCIFKTNFHGFFLFYSRVTTIVGIRKNPPICLFSLELFILKLQWKQPNGGFPWLSRILAEKLKTFLIKIGPCHLPICRLKRQNLSAVVGKLSDEVRYLSSKNRIL
jgi:hypothetical protein